MACPPIGIVLPAIGTRPFGRAKLAAMAQTPPVTVDVHAHLVPRELVEAVRTRPVGGVSADSTEDRGYRFRFPDGSATRRLPDRLVDIDDRLTWMDGEGIDLHVLSSWADIFAYQLSPRDGARWCELVNQTLKEVTAARSRFISLASLPMQSPSDAVVMLKDVMGCAPAALFR